MPRWCNDLAIWAKAFNGCWVFERVWYCLIGFDKVWMLGFWVFSCSSKISCMEKWHKHLCETKTSWPCSVVCEVKSRDRIFIQNKCCFSTMVKNKKTGCFATVFVNILCDIFGDPPLHLHLSLHLHSQKRWYLIPNFVALIFRLPRGTLKIQYHQSWAHFPISVISAVSVILVHLFFV